uniref:Uncharacterized protein n=1 Tax=Physcomitrium patens TaxID=3218 RepID=A0A2K1KX75_PHYPA|nr:hypothetical protein PHYPA_005345 [Physcomitrium patens]
MHFLCSLGLLIDRECKGPFNKSKFRNPYFVSSINSSKVQGVQNDDLCHKRPRNPDILQHVYDGDMTLLHLGIMWKG